MRDLPFKGVIIVFIVTRHMNHVEIKTKSRLLKFLKSLVTTRLGIMI